MKKILFVCLLSFVAIGCATKETYDINRVYNLKEQNVILTGIVTHIFSAPAYTKMQDRFDFKHRAYYSSLTSKFSVEKYFISNDSTHYFYVIRPSSIASERRAVGGHFKMNKSFQLKEFKEEFVTTVMTEQDLKNKASFLFDEMVRGNLTKYLQMKTYIQWPNESTYYDSTSYEWKLKPDAVN